MSFILGFGSTEKDFEKKLESKITEHVLAEFEKTDKLYFRDSFVDKINGWIEALSEESRKEAESCKKAIDYPDRYSSFYSNIIANASYIVFIIGFHHINRRHAMSPDGWALMTNEITFNVKCY